MGEVDRLDQNIATYILRTEARNGGGQSSVSAKISVQTMHFKFTYTKKRTQGKSHLIFLDFNVALLTRITDVTEEPPK